jgi:hypothetical protein
MKFLNRFKFAAVLAAVALPLLGRPPAAQAQVLDTPFVNDAKPTNALAGVGGLHTTNVLFHFTNGSTTVTSAPIALHGRGFALSLEIATTNSLLTNAVNEFRFSWDGTNWFSEPTLLWRSAAIAATGKYPAGTNVIEDAFRNFKWIQHWKIHLTNGVNNLGEIFSTNRPPVMIHALYD